MNRAATVFTVILLILCATGRAAEQYASPAAVFLAIPEPLRAPPADGDKWTVQKIMPANEWLRLHVEGKSVAAVFDFTSVSNISGRRNAGHASASGTCPRDMPKEITELYFKGLFSGTDDVAKLKKAKRRDSFTCAGVIKHASIAFRPATNELVFNIEIEQAVLK